MKTVVRVAPHIVKYCGEKPNFLDTVLRPQAVKAICNLCQIPEKFEHLVSFVEVVRPGGGGPRRYTDVVLSVGDTEYGVIPDNLIANVGRVMLDGLDPEWHLDPDRWFWELALRESCRSYRGVLAS